MRYVAEPAVIDRSAPFEDGPTYERPRYEELPVDVGERSGLRGRLGLAVLVFGWVVFVVLLATLMYHFL